MKRILAILFATLLIASMAACSDSEADGDKATSSVSTVTGTGFNNNTDNSSAIVVDGNVINDEVIPGININCEYEDDKSKTVVNFVFEDNLVIDATYTVTYYTEEDAKDSYNNMMQADEDVYYDIEINESTVTYGDTSLNGKSMDEIIEMCTALGEWTRG